MQRPYNVLILCTGNSARSILGEALFNTLGAGRFRAYSAGSHPKGRVHPMAIELARSIGYPVQGLRSKSWDEFAAPRGPELNFVITVCDKAAGEVCPLWPGQPITTHWGFPDPAVVEGPEDVQREAFAQTLRQMCRRVELFLALPVETLDRLALEAKMRAIGKEPL
jgi:arsenate reductase (thioredoxin)